MISETGPAKAGQQGSFIYRGSGSAAFSSGLPPLKRGRLGVVKEIEKMVKAECRKKTNYFGFEAWTHIRSVVKFSRILAKKLGADEETVVLAALMHDLAGIVNYDWYPEHHSRGAKLAEEILRKYKYSPEKIAVIKNSIFRHRASISIEKDTLEAKILASADSLAHFDNVDALMHLAYDVHKMEIDEGREWVLAKLARSWQKLMPEAKDIIKDKYEAIKVAFSK